VQSTGDLNFYADPAAVNVLMELNLKKTVIPLELCIQVPFTTAYAYFDQLTNNSASSKCAGSVVQAYIQHIDQWHREFAVIEAASFSRFPEHKAGGPFPWETVARWPSCSTPKHTLQTRCVNGSR
jgi:hypothetical protein